MTKMSVTLTQEVVHYLGVGHHEWDFQVKEFIAGFGVVRMVVA